MARRRKKNPSATTTTLLAMTAAVVGGAVGFYACRFAIGWGTAKAIVGGGPLDVVVVGSMCSLDGDDFACDDLLRRLTSVSSALRVAPDREIRLYVESASSGTVHALLSQLAASGFSNVAVIEEAPQHV